MSFPLILDWLIRIAVGGYFLLTLSFIIAWVRTRRFRPSPLVSPSVRVSVIVAVRNEANAIPSLLRDLNVQDHPTEQLEVIVVDDHSTDETPHLVASFPARYALRLLSLRDFVTEPLLHGNYKKKALEMAVQHAQGELIIATDGDCRVGKAWVRAYAQFYQRTNAQLISGPVTFHDEQSVFERFQTVEFASLIGSGAATLAMGVPTMGNGANIAYARAAFQRVNGYAGADGTPSGDDIFLMHKIHRAYPGSIRFLKSAEAIVHTRAQPTWHAFYQQRKRWASKWNAYSDVRVRLLAVFIFGCNALLVVAGLGASTGNYPVSAFCLQIAAKLSVEFVFLTLVLRFLRKEAFTWLIVPLQIVYPLYVAFFGLAAQRKGYRWKDRTIQ